MEEFDNTEQCLSEEELTTSIPLDDGSEQESTELSSDVDLEDLALLLRYLQQDVWQIRDLVVSWIEKSSS